MDDLTMSAKQLSEVKQLISEYAGLSFSGNRARALDCALAEFLRNRPGLPLHPLFGRLKTDKTLLREIIEYLLVHETYFFREYEGLVSLKERLLDASQARTILDRPFRIWSAGCSTGEEAYSLAILLCNSPIGMRFDIVASDLSEQSLEKAREATYSPWSLRGVSEQLKEEHFLHLDSRYLLKDDKIRERVTFVAANLAEERQLTKNWYPLDAIVCRNVLIYFDRRQITSAARMFFDSMRAGGYLLTGASDPILSDFADFEVQSTEYGAIYRKPVEKSKDRSSVTLSTSKSVCVAPIYERVSSQVPDLSVSENALLAGAYVDYASGNWNDVISALSGHTGRGLSILVKSLLNLSRASEAVRIATEVSTADPLREDALLLTALAFMDLKDYIGAAERAKRAIFLDRNFIYAHFLLGVTQCCLQDHRRAIKSLNNAQLLLSQLGADEAIKLAEELTHKQLAADIKRYLNLIGAWSSTVK